MALQGKVAVITGGNSGIGLATALEFRANGAQVAVFGRNLQSLEAAAGQCPQSPPIHRVHNQELENPMAKLITRTGSSDHKVVSRAEWLTARRALLEKEKELFRLHDRLKAQRRDLPWVKIDKEYTFDGPNGRETLADLFADHHQLIIYHFMFGPQWQAGCPHCSFWADHYDGVNWHIGQRDTTLVAVSRAPLEKIEAFKQRMGWKFKWVSSGGGDFNFDFQASFTPEMIASGAAVFNYAPVDRSMTGMSEREGASAFYQDDTGAIYHTYSTWARGIDLLNNTYNFLDLTAKGRDEDPENTQSWVKHHDGYAPSGRTGGAARRR